MSKPEPRAGYHHGNLREALIDAAQELMEQGGPANVSVREAAKRVGVSVGAPFRHFPDRTALMTAVAERTMVRFCEEISSALSVAAQEDPLARLLAVGRAYLRWATLNPAGFQVISNRGLIDWESSASLRRDNLAVRTLMNDALAEAQDRGLLRSADTIHAQIASRALVYGLARMFIDGHFAQWAVSGSQPEDTMRAVLDLFVELLGKECADDRRAPT